MDVIDMPPATRPFEAPASSRDTRLPRRVVLGCLLFTSFGTGVVLSIVGPTVPAIAARLGVPEAAIGIVFTASFLAATVTTAASGAIFNRIGGRALIPTGISAMALGLLGEGAAGAMPLLVLSAVLAGAGTGIINVSVNASAGRLYPARRESILTWLNVCFGIGAFFTPLVAGFGLTRLGGYTPTYLLGAAVLAVPIVPLLLGLPGPAAQAGNTAAGRVSLAGLLRDRNLRLLTVLAAMYLGAEIGFGGWIVTIVARMTQLAPAQLTPAASAFWICLAAGGAPTTFLLKRGVPSRRLIVLGALAAAAGSLLLAVLGGSGLAAVICCALIGLAFSPILPLTTALAVGQGSADGSDGARIAAIFTVGQVGAATLPALQGALLGGGPRLALSLTAGCALAMAALAAAVTVRERQA